MRPPAVFPAGKEMDESCHTDEELGRERPHPLSIFSSMSLLPSSSHLSG